MKKRICAVAVLAAASAMAFGRIDNTKFHIFSSVQEPMGYDSEEQIRALVDCGIDTFAAKFSREGLDNCRKYGINAIVRGYIPGWWGGNAELNGKFAEQHPVELYEKLMREYPDHPAVVAFEIGDEPSALDFEHYGKVAAVVERYSSAYLNLFPNYASSAALTGDAAKSQLGARDYEDYIAKYCKCVPIPQICFDSYIWGWRNTPSVLLENLRIAADACLATHRSLMVELQLLTFEENGKLGKGPMTANNLRYQANVALAFGARQINWINFWGAWWAHHILGKDGRIANPEMYGRLKAVNRELRRHGDILVRFERTHTDFVDFDPSSGDGMRGVRQPSLGASDGVAFSAVKADDSSALLVGHFVSRAGDGVHAMFLVSCDDPQDAGGKDHVVSFRSEGRSLRAVGGEGPVGIGTSAAGVKQVRVRSNGAVLVVASARP